MSEKRPKGVPETARLVRLTNLDFLPTINALLKFEGIKIRTKASGRGGGLPTWIWAERDGMSLEESQWFGAKILMRSFLKETGEELTGEETVRLVHAKDLKEAEQKAIEFGKTLQHTYKAAAVEEDNGKEPGTIEVKFEEVLDVYDISDPLREFVEIYSLLITPKEVAYYKDMYAPAEDEDDERQDQAADTNL